MVLIRTISIFKSIFIQNLFYWKCFQSNLYWKSQADLVNGKQTGLGQKCFHCGINKILCKYFVETVLFFSILYKSAPVAFSWMNFIGMSTVYGQVLWSFILVTVITDWTKLTPKKSHCSSSVPVQNYKTNYPTLEVIITFNYILNGEL